MSKKSPILSNANENRNNGDLKEIVEMKKRKEYQKIRKGTTVRTGHKSSQIPKLNAKEV